MSTNNTNDTDENTNTSHLNNPNSENRFAQQRRIFTEPYTTTNSKEIKEIAEQPHSSAFPRKFTHAGYLDIRTKPDKSWKRRYCVLSNNFLLFASTPHASKPECVIGLEGSNIKYSTQTSDMTFEIQTGKKPIYFRAASPQQCDVWTQHIERASTLKIKDIYRFLYTLGMSDSQMTKVVAAKHRTTQEDCAIKIVDKRTCDQHMLRTEIKILKKLDSDYIVSLYDLFETKKFLYIVMEKCAGGELFEQIAELDGAHYSEYDCCNVMQQIAEGVKYMHSVGIVHRDLKPENILCVIPSSIQHVKIADFGISKMITNNERMMHTMVGTLSYTAPEILRNKNGYDHSCDYWSIGVIMYILLCGYPPFCGETEQEISHSIVKKSVEFDEEDWAHVSQNTRELVAGLLCKNPKERSSCEDILKLAWKYTAMTKPFPKKTHEVYKKTWTQHKQHRQSVGITKGISETNGSKYKDDSSMMNQQQVQRHINNQINAFRGNQGSKVVEELEPVHENVDENGDDEKHDE